MLSRDGYAAVPTTPRQDLGLEIQKSGHSASASLHSSSPQHGAQRSKQAAPQSALPASLPAKADHLRLTPVRRVRDPQKECKFKSPRAASLYDASNSRTDLNPGPGQYFVDRDTQHKKQDFRRPHDPKTDGPFFLKEHDVSTRVKAMARSLKTPDSGLGPGLYETAPSSYYHHAPQVAIGGYAPREAATKQKALSYSRAIMSVSPPLGMGHLLGGPGQHDSSVVQPHWASESRTQGGAGSSNKPCTTMPSPSSKGPNASPECGKVAKPGMGAAAKGDAAGHCRPAKGSRAVPKQGSFEPPWTSMRRKAAAAGALPSDWGWVACTPQQGLFSKGAWAGDGRLEANHQSLLTPDNAGPLLRSAEPTCPASSPAGSRGPSHMLRSVPSPVLLPTRLAAASPTQQHMAAVSPTEQLMLAKQPEASLSAAAATQGIKDPERTSLNQQPDAAMQLKSRPQKAGSNADHAVGDHHSQQEVLQKGSDVQPCRRVLRSLDLFDEAEYFRHKQALKASKHVQDVQQQHLLWQARSSASTQGDPPPWLQAIS